MYLIVNKNDKVLSIGNKAAAFEDKQEALKVISKHKDLRLVWKPQHDDDIVLSPKEFDKLINRWNNDQNSNNYTSYTLCSGPESCRFLWDTRG